MRTNTYELYEKYTKEFIINDIRDNYNDDIMDIEEYLDIKSEEIIKKFRIAYNGIEIANSQFMYWEEDDYFIMKCIIEI